jgi:small-conductance mechanosensitive channel
MIIVKKPFKVGDRIIVSDYVGDVSDITLTHVILNQVGGSVSGEENSGRGILIPNGTLFNQVVVNYTLDERYMLDEVIVRITFDSDYDLAERLCLEALNESYPEMIADSGFEPSTRCELYDHGVLMRVRYKTIPVERQLISTRITREILEKFKENFDAVKCCYPHSVVEYKMHRGVGDDLRINSSDNMR